MTICSLPIFCTLTSLRVKNFVNVTNNLSLESESMVSKNIRKKIKSKRGPEVGVLGMKEGANVMVG